MFREVEVEYGGTRFYVREMGAYQFYRSFAGIEEGKQEQALYRALKKSVRRKRFGIKYRAFWTVRGLLGVSRGCLAALSEAFNEVHGVSDPNA